MADVLTDDAINYMAQFILGGPALVVQLRLGLFVNNVEFTNETEFADLVLCTAPGYAPIDLPWDHWVGGTADGMASYAYPLVSFGITGPGNPAQTVFGHVVYTKGSNVALWGQTWPNPWQIPNPTTSNPSLQPFWQDEQCS